MATQRRDDTASSLPAGDPRTTVDKLRAALASAEELGDVAQLVGTISETVGELSIENWGMANELLSVYEQLGVVFDVTRKLADVQNDREILGLFVGSLRRSFSKRAVLVARRETPRLWMLDDTETAANAWLCDRLSRACARRAAIVEAPPEGTFAGGLKEVMVAPILAGDALVCGIVLLRPADVPEFQASEMMLVDSLTTFCGDVIRNHRLVYELREMSVSMVRSLVNAVDQKDPYTCGHSLRVAYFATALGRRLNMREVELQMLQWSALLHDVGKIGIREDVLNKPGRLSEDEFSHIQEHPVRSHQVVRGVPQLANALDGILYHHERYNGTGYPAGRKGEEIPLQARIIQIADVFDALTSDRSYRRAYDWRRALEIMEEEAGVSLDPHLQKAFAELMNERLGDKASSWSAMIAEANAFAQTADTATGEA
ncbi:MAG: HD-GYP domain-containing protein [Dehalococcoidia bacterium]